MRSRCYDFSTSIHGQRRLSSQQKRSTVFQNSLVVNPRKSPKEVERLSLGSRLLVDRMKQIKTHFVCKLIVKLPSLVKHSVHVSPLAQLLIVVESADLHFVKPVILSPVWSCLEFFKEFVFHHLLKLFSSESSGEEWYLK